MMAKKLEANIENQLKNTSFYDFSNLLLKKERVPVLTIETLERAIGNELKSGKYYDLTKLKIKAKTYRNLKNLECERSHCIFTYERKAGHLFQFKNVLGGYFMTLSAAQLNGRFKEININELQKNNINTEEQQ